jgi:hypothetical protein
MSTRYDDIWKKGETWSAIIACTKEDGTDLNPTAADWKLKSLDGATTLFALTGGSGLTISGNNVSINIETTSQTMDAKAYRHRLKVTDSSGAISRQVHGIIRVVSDE